MGSGRVIVLHGTTSASTSTLARVLQRELAARREPWVIGMAAAQSDVVRSFATSDVRVDTGLLTPVEAADAILR